MNALIHDGKTQDNILLAMTSQISTYGWTLQCLEQAVIDLGFAEGEAKRAFQGNLDYVFDHLIEMIDRQMGECLETVDLSSYRVRDRVVFLIMLRLKLMRPYRDLLSQAIKHQSFSGSLKNLSQKFFGTVSNIWYTAGDQATDFNYYSKRFLLSGVYASTFLYWLQDDSLNFAKTQIFLENRIDQVMKVSSWLRRFKSVTKNVN
ncbi:MAG: COQ9 family protein [Janthinobacterium lividum]